MFISVSLYFRAIWLTGGSHHARTGRQFFAGNFPSKTGTHLHLGRVRKWRFITSPKDKTRSTDAGNRTLDPKIQSPTLYRLSQQDPSVTVRLDQIMSVYRYYVVLYSKSI